MYFIPILLNSSGHLSSNMDIPEFKFKIKLAPFTHFMPKQKDHLQQQPTEECPQFFC